MFLTFFSTFFTGHSLKLHFKITDYFFSCTKEKVFYVIFMITQGNLSSFLLTNYFPSFIPRSTSIVKYNVIQNKTLQNKVVTSPKNQVSLLSSDFPLLLVPEQYLKSLRQRKYLETAFYLLNTKHSQNIQRINQNNIRLHAINLHHFKIVFPLHFTGQSQCQNLVDVHHIKGCLVRNDVPAAPYLRHGTLAKCLTQSACSGHFKKVREISTSALQRHQQNTSNSEEWLKTLICSQRLFWYSKIQQLGSRVNPKSAL